MWKGIIHQYRDFFQLPSDAEIVTLYEGNTPLLRASKIERLLHAKASLYLKCEGANPTGSFKDRGMTMAITHAKAAGNQAVICASTGNTSASAAAFAARAGLKAYVLVPEGKIALGKLSQAMIHGARVLQVSGNFDEALKIVKEIASSDPVVLVNSANPHRIEGQKSAAFEICDRLGNAPTFHSLPVGNAGNITAYFRGYRSYHERGISHHVPKMLGFQAEGAAPIVRDHVVLNPETIATAIRIGNPEHWQNALSAVKESGGRIEMIPDEEILLAYQQLAKEEGIFCEPASAISVAGVFALDREGFFQDGATIVCTLTGHGLKDPECAIKVSGKTEIVVPEMNQVRKVLCL